MFLMGALKKFLLEKIEKSTSQNLLDQIEKASRQELQESLQKSVGKIEEIRKKYALSGELTPSDQFRYYLLRSAAYEKARDIPDLSEKDKMKFIHKSHNSSDTSRRYSGRT
jgi:hypothetical protein